ncbi:energy-coupling factor transporter ATPase [Candidatus Woesearchaeota archaeon]|jgi:energy-coupling factor transport system ATP-binding protein|nr:energy-coupling factor transporter ATPase [Candidatus Woesearchaeota archaeon]|tara:strand:- start:388 stop:1086 length:699 start_codon:yes stop_codon:yes gene_type:complete
MIQIKSLYFKYEDELVLNNINLNIEEGSYTAIIGANGSGKTTLAKHINALLLPTKGSVTVDSIDTKQDQFNVRKNVGFVFQNPEDQLVYSIVDEDLAFGLENLGTETKNMKKKVKEIMEDLKITYLAKKNVNMISAGQKQLTALAGILVMEPKYIVFDEPTTTLDNKNKANIMSIITKLNKKSKIGIILVTNLLSDIKYAENVIVMNNGEIIFNDKKLKLNKTILKKAGLDV